MKSWNWVGYVIIFLQFIKKNLAYPLIETSTVGNIITFKM